MDLIKTEKLIKQTKVKIISENRNNSQKAIEEIIKQREILEDYIKKNPKFEDSHSPLLIKESDPEIVKKMKTAAIDLEVGPMAAVAGTIAQFACQRMKKEGSRIAIIDNGGDIYIISDREIKIGLFSDSKFDNIGFSITKTDSPLAICSSSSTMGHSHSYGDCDLAVVFSRKAEYADCAATKLANNIRKAEDIEQALNEIMKNNEIIGALAIKNEKFGAIGKIPEIIFHKDKRLKEKITKDDIYEL